MKNAAKESTGISLIKDLERVKVDAGEVSGALADHYSELVRLRGELLDGIQQDVKDHEDRLLKVETELKGDLSRLMADVSAKQSRIRDIQSKFSFVLGAVTERIDEALVADVDKLWKH